MGDLVSHGTRVTHPAEAKHNSVQGSRRADRVHRLYRHIKSRRKCVKIIERGIARTEGMNEHERSLRLRRFGLEQRRDGSVK